MIIQAFLVAFIVSFLGSIPPGTINITVMQMGLLGKLREAYFLVLGATIVEFFYAMLVVRFQIFLNENVTFTHHFTLITSIVLTLLGIYSLLTRSYSKSVKVKSDSKGRTGFAKGLALGFLNPLAIPFWLAVTAYLQQSGWVSLEGASFWSYLLGIFAGSVLVLYLAIRLGNKFTRISDNYMLVHVLPGVAFLSLGIYYFYQWLAQ